MNRFIISLAFPLFLLLGPTVAQASSDFDWNVSTNPVGLLFGPDVRLEYKLSDHITLGPVFRLFYFHLNDVKANGISGGLEASYYFNETYMTGWYATIGAIYGTLHVEATNDPGHVDTLDINNFSVEGVGGYHWFWGRFNLAVGLGLAVNSGGSKKITDHNGNDIDSAPISTLSLAGEAALGLTF